MRTRILPPKTYHQIDSRELLAELTQTAEESTPEVLRRTVGEQLTILESTPSALDVERLLNTVQFCENIGMI